MPHAASLVFSDTRLHINYCSRARNAARSTHATPFIANKVIHSSADVVVGVSEMRIVDITLINLLAHFLI